MLTCRCDVRRWVFRFIRGPFSTSRVDRQRLTVGVKWWASTPRAVEAYRWRDTIRLQTGDSPNVFFTFRFNSTNMCIVSGALANLFFVSLFCRSSFLCFRPMDIICENEYWSVMLCCLIPLSRWRASKSERERLLRPRRREAVQEEKTGRYRFQTKQINTGRYRSQTHAYLCQHRCLTAT